MYLLLTLPAGVVLEAIVLYQMKDRMRIVVPEFSDSLELQRIDGRWVLDGDAVQFEFLAATQAAKSAEPRKKMAALSAAS